jgi:hypothetical protein
MHAGGLQPNGTLRECCEPAMMGRWTMSQLMKESGANAFEPCAAEHFMQMNGHRGDGE